MLVEVRGEMNHRIVLADSLHVVRIEDVETRAAGKIVGGEKLADVSSQVTTATGNKNSHLLAPLSAVTPPRARSFSRRNDSALPIATSRSPFKICVSPLG